MDVHYLRWIIIAIMSPKKANKQVYPSGQGVSLLKYTPDVCISMASCGGFWVLKLQTQTRKMKKTAQISQILQIHSVDEFPLKALIQQTFISLSLCCWSSLHVGQMYSNVNSWRFGWAINKDMPRSSQSCFDALCGTRWCLCSCVWSSGLDASCATNSQRVQAFNKGPRAAN